MCFRAALCFLIVQHRVSLVDFLLFPQVLASDMGRGAE